MQPYQAYSVIQAGPVRSEIEISQYIKHPANVTTVGRSGAATIADLSASNSGVSPHGSPYTQATIQVGAPSSGATARPESPPPPTAGPVDSPSIVLGIGPNFPTLRARTNKEFFYSSDSPSRSPSPDAEQLISSLANYQTLSDDALYDVTLKAQQAMVKWQNEYKALQKDVSRTSKPSKNSKVKAKAKPCKLEEPLETDEKHYDSLHHFTPKVTQTTATAPIKPPALKSRNAHNDLHIDMTESMQPLNGKRIRKPRVLDTAASKPTLKNPTKRPHDPDRNSRSLADQPKLKRPKQEPRHRSCSPLDSIRTAKPEAEELTSAAEIASAEAKAVGSGLDGNVLEE